MFFRTRGEALKFKIGTEKMVKRLCARAGVPITHSLRGLWATISGTPMSIGRARSLGQEH